MVRSRSEVAVVVVALAHDRGLAFDTTDGTLGTVDTQHAEDRRVPAIRLLRASPVSQPARVGLVEVADAPAETGTAGEVVVACGPEFVMIEVIRSGAGVVGVVAEVAQGVAIATRLEFGHQFGTENAEQGGFLVAVGTQHVAVAADAQRDAEVDEQAVVEADRAALDRRGQDGALLRSSTTGGNAGTAEFVSGCDRLLTEAATTGFDAARKSPVELPLQDEDSSVTELDVTVSIAAISSAALLNWITAPSPRLAQPQTAFRD